MKPVAIFRHFRTEGPGYFSSYLDRHRLPWHLIRVDEGEPIPAGADSFSGYVFMGGPMSVNDDLPWVPPVLALIREAVAKDVPVLGHCLGGQLLCKALGGIVSRTVLKEIGWGEVQVAEHPVARAWFGNSPKRFAAFHWHGETFSNPRGTVPLLSSPWCQNQAFALGPHLALQCHLEITEELVRAWCGSGQREIERRGSPAVQTVEAIGQELDARVRALHAVADAVYGRWVEGLKR